LFEAKKEDARDDVSHSVEAADRQPRQRGAGLWRMMANYIAVPDLASLIFTERISWFW